MLASSGSSSSSQKPKCAFCQKKLGLVNFSCRCGGLFCSVHRLDSDHKCSFDFRKENQSLLSTTLEKVVGRKVDVL
jgi:predicted nucleic acid binding AN1-type Zn finger protein